MSTIIKYRKRVPKVLQQILNTQELHRTFTSQAQVEELNTLLNESVVILSQGLPLEITAPIVLRNGLDRYVKQLKTTAPKTLHLKDVTALYLAYSKENVTVLEQRRRVTFFTKVLPNYWSSCKIPSELEKVTSKHLYILSQHMSLQPNPRNPKETNKPQTVNRYIKMIKGMVNYGLSTGLFTLPNTMPTLKLNKATEANRAPLNTIEYKLLCSNLYGQELILLNTIYLSGLRSSEVHKSTIKTINNVVCFDLTSPSEKLKTKASYRMVPVHTKLLPHIDTIEAFTKQDVLRLSRNINSNIKELFTDSAGKSLYSARHSVVTNLVKGGVPIERVQQIVGHSNSASMTMGVYFGGYDIQQLQEDINTL